jgi:hypothetical protein
MSVLDMSSKYVRLQMGRAAGGSGSRCAMQPCCAAYSRRELPDGERKHNGFMVRFIANLHVKKVCPAPQQ